MSGLRENLGEWARGHGTHVAETVAERETGVRAAITRRRRSRGVGTVATAAATIVGVVALASALPGVNEAPPADRLPRHLSELVCGDPWVVEPGTTSYVSEPDYYFSEPQGDWVLTDDNGDTHTGYSGFTAGLGSVAWQGDIDVRHRVIVRARVVAVKAGEIVGVTEDQYARPRDGGGAALNANAPHPGPCGDTTAGSSSGKVTYHLVMQVQSVESDAKTIATIVDPGGPKVVAIDGVEEWLKERAVGPADPLAPQGDRYQAFLVPRPTEASCKPFQDLIAEGYPLSTSASYELTLPGMASLDSILGADAPVMDSDSGTASGWLMHANAWLVLSAGSNPTRALGWSDGFTKLAPSDTGPRPPGQLDCMVTLQNEQPSGGVYLVIDAVDWDALHAQNPLLDLATSEGWQTWVYLGQVENTSDPDDSLGLP